MASAGQPIAGISVAWFFSSLNNTKTRHKDTAHGNQSQPTQMRYYDDAQITCASSKASTSADGS
jgi:hypothetical protein